MPIYEYECGACGDAHEFIQKFSEGPKRKCPSCGRQRLRKKVSAAAFHLKGDGWYVTDFRDKSGKKDKKDKKIDTDDAGGKTEITADTKSDAGSDTKTDSKSDTKPDTESDKKSDSGAKKSGSGSSSKSGASAA